MSDRIVLVTGSRAIPRTHWVPIMRQALEDTLAMSEELIVMHGACPHPMQQPGKLITASIDMMADEWCVQRKINVLRFPADWSQGRNAGLRRNEFMVRTLRDFVYGSQWTCSVIAFSPDIDRSGTGHCVRYARKMGINVMYYDGENPAQFMRTTS